MGEWSMLCKCFEEKNALESIFVVLDVLLTNKHINSSEGWIHVYKCGNNTASVYFKSTLLNLLIS